jgi:hypothetical protein
LESLIGGAAGLKGEDFAAVVDGAAELCELAGVGTYVEDEVEVEKREESAVTELLRTVYVSLPNLMAGGFYYGADGVSYGVRHVVVISRRAVAKVEQRADSYGISVWTGRIGCRRRGLV